MVGQNSQAEMTPYNNMNIMDRDLADESSVNQFNPIQNKPQSPLMVDKPKIDLQQSLPIKNNKIPANCVMTKSIRREGMSSMSVSRSSFNTISSKENNLDIPKDNGKQLEIMNNPS